MEWYTKYLDKNYKMELKKKMNKKQISKLRQMQLKTKFNRKNCYKIK